MIAGLGTDIVDVLRIGRLIERHGDHFLRRIYSPAEIADCQRRREYLQHFAAHWSGKQAVVRALGTGFVRGLSWLDVELTLQPTGEFLVTLRGRIRELADRQGVGGIRVAAAYCRAYATATAIAVNGPPLMTTQEPA